MKVAYADPPYIGFGKYYPEKEEVDHSYLIYKLCSWFDSWALSCHSPSLKKILPMCPDSVRVAAWVKPFCSFKPNVQPAYAWEPVIFWNARARGRHIETPRDWVAANMTLEKGLVGAKPPRFCFWLFDLLGLEIEDDLIDLFPGTGIVARCWESWKDQQSYKQLEMILDAKTR